jgi:prephenate dehydratase
MSAPIVPVPPAARVSFQGEAGANSHIAIRARFPGHDPLACPTFEDAFAAVQEGEAEYGMIPIENTLAGRVSDVHHLLPDSGLHIVGEHFMPIRFQLMGPPGATLEGVRRARSHPMGLGQCRRSLRALGIAPVITADTAGAAREVAALGDPSEAALAPDLAAEVYGLDILRRDMEDAAHNTTRFVILSRTPRTPARDAGACMTSFVFRVRNIPAALFKALGGFATNGVNMTKLESYQIEGSFAATQFHADIEGHPDDPAVIRALDELRFFSAEVTMLGTYPADPFRRG